MKGAIRCLTRQRDIKEGKHLKFSSMSYVFHFTDSVTVESLRNPYMQQRYLLTVS